MTAPPATTETRVGVGVGVVVRRPDGRVLLGRRLADPATAALLAALEDAA